MRELKTMGRPREFDADVALTKIMEIFWDKGFEGASLNDLVAATRLKKGSLYAAFGSKREMYLKALALYDRSIVDSAVELLCGSGTAKKRIGRFLQSAIDSVAVQKDRRGCFLCNASVDQAALDSQTEYAVRRSLKRLADALGNALSSLPLDHAENQRPHPSEQLFLSTYFGLRVLAKAGHPIQSLKDARNAALQSIPPDE